MASFRLCLNSSTLSNQTLGIVAELEIAAAAGFDGVELWLPSIHAHVQRGGSLVDIARRADDLGIAIENGIGFAPWIVDDDTTRNEGLESARRDMEALAAIGCRRIAAPPMGAVDATPIPLDVVTERFDVLCDIGREVGVTPQLEIWGFAANLFELSQLLEVARHRSHPSTSILLDVFHLVRGGTGLDLGPLAPGRIEIFHINDLPGGIAPADLIDADRVLPGSGVVPIGDLVNQMADLDGEIVLSLELFDRDLWESEPGLVAARAFEALASLID